MRVLVLVAMYLVLGFLLAVFVVPLFADGSQQGTLLALLLKPAFAFVFLAGLWAIKTAIWRALPDGKLRDALYRRRSLRG